MRSFVLLLVVLIVCSVLFMSLNAWSTFSQEKESATLVAKESFLQTKIASTSNSPGKQPRWSYQSVGTVNVVEVSSNGAYVLMGTSDGYVYIFNTSSNVPLDAVNMEGSVIVLDVSSHGEYVAAATGNILNVYNISTSSFQYIWSFTNDPGAQGGIYSLAFSSDGRYLVVGTWGHESRYSMSRTWIHVFEVTSGVKIWSMKVNEGWIDGVYDYVSVDISSDGQYITAGSTYNHNVYLFNQTSPTPLHTYDTGSAVNSVSISSDGQYFAVGSSEVHYFKNCVTVPQWSHDIGGTVSSISISNDAIYIVAVTGNYLFLLKNDNTEVWRYNVGDSVGAVSFSADGKYIVTKSGNYVHVFSTSVDGNLGTPTHDPIWSYDTKATVNSVSISSDGRYTVAGSGSYVYLFDMSFDPDLTPTYVQFSNNNPTDGDTISISAKINNIGNLDSLNAFVTFYDGAILIGTTQIGSISPGSHIITQVSCTLSPSGVHAIKVIVDPDNLIYESNETNNALTKNITVNSFPFVDTGANPIVTDVTQTGTANSISISGDGYYIVLGTSDNYIYLLFKNHTTPIWGYNSGSPINVVSISSDGSYIAAAEVNTLYVFSRTNREPLWSFTNDPGAQGGIYSLAFSSDGRYLVVGTWGHESRYSMSRTWIHVFEVTSGVKIWSMKVNEGWIDGVYDYVSVDISSDGQYITAGSTYNHNVYLFNQTSPTPMYMYDTGSSVNSIAMSSNGQYFVAGGDMIYYFTKDVIVPLWTRDIGGTVNSVSISSDSTYITATRDTYLYLLKNDNTEVWNYNIAETIGQALISADGNNIAVKSGNSVYLFSRTTDGKSMTPAHDPVWSYDTRSTVNSISISSDGRYTTLSSAGRIFYFDVLHEADLIPVSITFSKDKPNEAETITISVTIQNIGKYKSYYANVSFYDGQTLIGNAHINPISPNALTIASKSYLCLSGYRTIKVIVDSDNKIYESNKTNNQLTTTIFVNARPTSVTLYGPFEVTATSMKLTWTQNTEADFAEYQVYQSTTSGQIGALVGTVQDQAITNYLVTDLDGSTTYYFTVRVVDTNSAFSDSNQVEGTTAPTPVVLNDPTKLKPMSMVLSWTKNIDKNFSRYEIYMSSSPGQLGTLIATLTNQSQTTYTLNEGIQPSTTYYFTIRVINPKDLFSDSNQLSVTTPEIRIPTAVVLNDPLNITTSSVLLTWSRSDDPDFYCYQILISSEPYMEYFDGIGTIYDQSATSYNVTGLQSSTTYYFVIRTYNQEQGYSDSNMISVATKTSSRIPLPLQPVSIELLIEIIVIGTAVLVGALLFRYLRRHFSWP